MVFLHRFGEIIFPVKTNKMDVKNLSRAPHVPWCPAAEAEDETFILPLVSYSETLQVI